MFFIEPGATCDYEYESDKTQALLDKARDEAISAVYAKSHASALAHMTRASRLFDEAVSSERNGYLISMKNGNQVPELP